MKNREKVLKLRAIAADYRKRTANLELVADLISKAAFEIGSKVYYKGNVYYIYDIDLTVTVLDNVCHKNTLYSLSSPTASGKMSGRRTLEQLASEEELLDANR